MTEPNRLRDLQRLERQLRDSIGTLAPFCQFITAFLVALLSERTVNLSWIAQSMPIEAQTESNRKRIQRFLEDQRVSVEAFARIVALLLPQAPWIIAIDRTNWFLGKTPLNLLVLAVVVVDWGVAVPLLWMPLPRDGASDTEQRKTLLARFLSLFARSRFDYVTADREFVGADWIAWLIEQQIPFRIRLRKDDRVSDAKGQVWEVAALFDHRSISCRKTPFTLWGSRVYLGGKPLPKEDAYLVIASNTAGPLLEDYRRRWKIECLFQALKGRGFQLEQTRVTQAHRLSALVGLLTLGYLWCVCAGRAVPAQICPSLGRLRQSLSRRGLDLLHRVAMSLVRPPMQWQREHAFRCFTPGKT